MQRGQPQDADLRMRRQGLDGCLYLSFRVAQIGAQTEIACHWRDRLSSTSTDRRLPRIGTEGFWMVIVTDCSKG